MNKKIKKSLFLLVFCFSAGFITSSCEKDEKLDYGWEEEEKEENGGEDGEVKPSYIWIDAAANFSDFANSKENIKRDLILAKEAGFTDVVVDVRPTNGDVLFQTDVADPVQALGAWLPGGYGRVERTATWDYLQAFIDAGHELGLGVHAAINTMVGGNRTSLGPDGMLYRETEKREWATQLLTQSGIQNTLDLPGNGARFFNPAHEEVQNYLLDMLEDLAAYEDLDGIFLDRGRYDNLASDFSDYSRDKFEDYLGHSIGDWPNEVVTKEMVAQSGLPAELPIYFKKWQEFRVKTIHDFMEKAQNRIKAQNPDIDFGVYVGAWYGSYYTVGVNWASPSYNTANYYSKWATPEYKDFGYADHMDVILIGAYAAPTRIYGSTEWTLQGFCALGSEKIKGDAIVIGGPDVGNGDWATTSESVVNSAITESVDAAMSACDGYFLFDMIHLKNKDQWEYVREGHDLVNN